MEYIIQGLAFLLIPLVVNGIFALLRKPKEAENGKVRLSKGLAVIGVICTTFFLVITFILAFSSEPIFAAIFFLGFSLFSSSLIIAFINCRISYDKYGFTVKNFFGVKRDFTYEDVTAIKYNMHETYIYIGKRRVMIDEFSVGGMEFIWLVQKKYKKLHKGENIPQAKTFDIFNGHIANSGELVAAYILASVCILAFTVFILWYGFAPSTVKNTQEQNVSFTTCTLKEGNVVMNSADGGLYKIMFTDESFDVEKVKALCDGKTDLTVYAKEFAPDDEPAYFAVKAIIYEGEYVLTFEETDRLQRQGYASLISIPLILFVLWVVFVVFSIIVGRNPKKYGKKIVRLFFKNEYVRY